MMNSVVVESFEFPSNRRLSMKSDRRFFSSKRKPRKNNFEIKPLISTNSNSSDDDITLHDIIYMKGQNGGENEMSMSSLRKIKKNDSSNCNGTFSESSKSSDPFKNCDFLHLKIEEGDSLQSISIKFQCAVSDIKRANNLISSQEFYALKTIKIPVKKYSLLTEILPSAQGEKSDSTIIEEHNVRTINIGIGPSTRSPSPQETAAFFKRMDEDLVKIMLNTKSQKESLEVAAATLTTPQIQPLVKDPYNTVDCGIQWNYLILCVIIVAIIIPAGMALYIYMRSSHENEHHIYPSGSSNGTFSSMAKTIKTKS